MRFYQVNCREGDKPDYRQGRSLLRRRPDIVIFEYPERNGGPALSFNKFSINKKPFKELESIKKELKRISSVVPYALSDILVWENIEKLWREGKNVLLFNVDAPNFIRKEAKRNNWLAPRSLIELKKEPVWWVYIYIREKYMAKNISKILKKNKTKDPLIAIFLQSFHWENVEFLLNSPSKEKIWEYYFGRFPGLDQAELEEVLKKKHKILFKEFKKVGSW